MKVYRSMAEAVDDGWAIPVFDIRHSTQSHMTKNGMVEYIMPMPREPIEVNGDVLMATRIDDGR